MITMIKIVSVLLCLVLGAMGILVIILKAKDKKTEELQKINEACLKEKAVKEAEALQEFKTLKELQKGQKENEEIMQNINKPNLSGHNNSIELMQKLSESGAKRNSNI